MTFTHSLSLSAAGRGVARRRACAAAAAPAGAAIRRRRRSSRRASRPTLTGDAGTPPRLAVPDFLALSNDRETQEIARTIGEVLWNDLDYEREFYMIPRDTYKSIPVAPSIGDPPFDRWRELGADGLVDGHGAEDRQRRCASRCGCTAWRRGSRSTRANTAGRRPTRGSTRTPSPTRSTSRSARCAASRAPS